MNESSRPKILKIKDWVILATEQLVVAKISTARLDSELIIAHALKKDRIWIHAHFDDIIDTKSLYTANKYLKLRKNRVPIAYILGYKEFYKRKFLVSPAVLIPRPESEDVIDLLKKHISKKHKTLIDVGTGSGALGITAKLEIPKIEVTLTDIDDQSLEIARKNISIFDKSIKVIQNDLLTNISNLYDVIIANLPYVDRTWERSPETNHEPSIALFAEKNGLSLIYKLIAQTNKNLHDNGLLILEADPAQHQDIIKKATGFGLSHLETRGYAVIFLKQQKI